MTPKEKAEELVKRLFNECDEMYAPGYIKSDKLHAAVKCALICVDELIKEENAWLEDAGAKYEGEWSEVKTELEKMI